MCCRTRTQCTMPVACMICIGAEKLRLSRGGRYLSRIALRRNGSRRGAVQRANPQSPTDSRTTVICVTQYRRGRRSPTRCVARASCIALRVAFPHRVTYLRILFFWTSVSRHSRAHTSGHLSAVRPHQWHRPTYLRGWDDSSICSICLILSRSGIIQRHAQIAVQQLGSRHALHLHGLHPPSDMNDLGS